MLKWKNHKIYFLELVLIILIPIVIYAFAQSYIQSYISERNRLQALVVEDRDDCIGGNSFTGKPILYSDDLSEMRRLALHEEDILDIYPHLQERHIGCKHYLFQIPAYEVTPIDGVRVYAEGRVRRGQSWGIYQDLVKYETEEQAKLAFAAEASTYPYAEAYLRKIQTPELYSFQQSKQVCRLNDSDGKCSLMTRYGRYISIIKFDTSQPYWQDRTNGLLKASDLRLRQQQ